MPRSTNNQQKNENVNLISLSKKCRSNTSHARPSVENVVIVFPENIVFIYNNLNLCMPFFQEILVLKIYQSKIIKDVQNLSDTHYIFPRGKKYN